VRKGSSSSPSSSRGGTADEEAVLESLHRVTFGGDSGKERGEIERCARIEDVLGNSRYKLRLKLGINEQLNEQLKETAWRYCAIATRRSEASERRQYPRDTQSPISIP